MWLQAVVSEDKTSAAQFTGQRRVVRPQGESPGFVLTFCRVSRCQSPPPTPFPRTIPPRRPMWSHTGFPNSLQALSERSSDQRSSLQKPVASRVSLPVNTNRSKIVTGYTVSMACCEPFSFGNVLPWKRCALGTICHMQCVCVIRDGVGWVAVGTAHARPPTARLHDSDAQRSCIGTPRG
jgi:hypothetical protein